MTHSHTIDTHTLHSYQYQSNYSIQMSQPLISKLYLRLMYMWTFPHGNNSALYHDNNLLVCCALYVALTSRADSSEYCSLIDIDVDVMYGCLYHVNVLCVCVVFIIFKYCVHSNGNVVLNPIL